jgi:hypothetical protein
LKNEPPASLKARSTPRKYFLASAGKMRKPKDFTPDDDGSFSRQGGGNLLESSFSPAFQNGFLCDLGALSDQRERAVHNVLKPFLAKYA